ncbi:hypothetical protein ES708_19608 [subsurface metagenome]
MEAVKLDRLRELIQKVTDSGGHLLVLPRDESLELQKLLRQKMSEEEFACSIFGED